MQIKKQFLKTYKQYEKKTRNVFAFFATVILTLSMIPFTVASAAIKTERESNNTRITSDNIEVDDIYIGKIGESGDIDYFRFFPKYNDRIKVYLSNIPSGKQYDLCLQDNNGNTLISNKSAGTSKYITYNVTANTAYFIVVNGSESSSGNYSSTQNYSLDLRSINYLYLPRKSYVGTPNIFVDASALPSPYSGYFTNAMSSWNSGSVHFTSNSSSQNKIYTDSYKDGWYGLYIPYTLNQSFYRFEIRINKRTIEEISSDNEANYYQGSMAHELGHSLGLDDNPETNAATLMRYDRDRKTIIGPQLFDVDAVRDNSVMYTSLTSTESCHETDSILNTDYKISDDETEIRIHSDYPEYISIETLYDEADLVVVCENQGNNFSMLKMGSDDFEFPYIISNFIIKDVLKGDDSLERVVVKQLGGTFDKVKYISDNVEQFKDNNTYLLFLKTYDDVPASLLNPVQGMYYVNGSEIIARDGNNIETNMFFHTSMDRYVFR